MNTFADINLAIQRFNLGERYLELSIARPRPAGKCFPIVIRPNDYDAFSLKIARNVSTK